MAIPSGGNPFSRALSDAGRPQPDAPASLLSRGVALGLSLLGFAVLLGAVVVPPVLTWGLVRRGVSTGAVGSLAAGGLLLFVYAVALAAALRTRLNKGARDGADRVG